MKARDLNPENPDRPDAERYRYLSWFLGPKAEQRTWFEDELLELFRDYSHWRANYFPNDPILLDRPFLRELGLRQDEGSQHLANLMARLRGNFPFYSPRYIGHMLSDTTMPSMLGYFAGMLYNANNVTTEAAPVSVDLELDACNKVLEMFGFRTAPKPDPTETLVDYLRRLPPRFGWAHCTFDGTTANIEALWMARNVKAMPIVIRALAVEAQARSAAFDLTVRLPGRDGASSRTASLIDLDDERQLLLLEPEAILDLIDNYCVRYSETFGGKKNKLGAALEAWHNIDNHPLSPRRAGNFGAFRRFRPRIYVSAAGHYSIQKAADILGLGRSSVCLIPVDEYFRMDAARLEEEIANDLKPKVDGSEQTIPLAVVSVLGTTEEGAVDPLHRVLQIRSKYEDDKRASFWVHTDAAWGGFINSMFVPPPKDILSNAEIEASRLLPILGLPPSSESVHDLVQGWIDKLTATAPESNKEHLVAAQQGFEKWRQHRKSYSAEHVLSELTDVIGRLRRADAELPPSLLQLTEPHVKALISRMTHWDIELSLRAAQNIVPVRWSEQDDVVNSFLNVHLSDSVVCDPHKMAYCSYPSGMVLFSDNRMRHCLRQEAPYITRDVHADVGIRKTHIPPRHPSLTVSGAAGAYQAPRIEAFGPYILEGSRPGAVATSLWLSLQCLPLHQDGHGQLVADVLRSARALHEWLIHWNGLCESLHEPKNQYHFAMLPAGPPDTNVVVFTILDDREGHNTLAHANALTKKVYDRFTIQRELGDARTSYEQPFFVSHDTLRESHYAYCSLQPFFKRSGFVDARDEYLDQGLFVLRATVMSPYHNASWKRGTNNYVREFVQTLAKAIKECQVPPTPAPSVPSSPVTLFSTEPPTT